MLIFELEQQNVKNEEQDEIDQDPKTVAVACKTSRIKSIEESKRVEAPERRADSGNGGQRTKKSKSK